MHYYVSERLAAEKKGQTYAEDKKTQEKDFPKSSLRSPSCPNFKKYWRCTSSGRTGRKFYVHIESGKGCWPQDFKNVLVR